MLFKDIKQNCPVYILNKQDMTFTEGKAARVGFSKMEMNPKTGKTEMIIDVDVEANGVTANYAFPDSLSLSYANNLVFSTDTEGIVRELEAMHNGAERFLAQVEQQKSILEKSKALLTELNPVYKERKATEQRFEKLEGSMARMEQMMTEFLKEWKK